MSDLFCRLKVICGIARTPANTPHENNIMPTMLAQFKDALTIFQFLIFGIMPSLAVIV